MEFLQDYCTTYLKVLNISSAKKPQPYQQIRSCRRAVMCIPALEPLCSKCLHFIVAFGFVVVFNQKRNKMNSEYEAEMKRLYLREISFDYT